MTELISCKLSNNVVCVKLDRIYYNEIFSEEFVKLALEKCNYEQNHYMINVEDLHYVFNLAS